MISELLTTSSTITICYVMDIAKVVGNKQISFHYDTAWLMFQSIVVQNQTAAWQLLQGLVLIYLKRPSNSVLEMSCDFFSQAQLFASSNLDERFLITKTDKWIDLKVDYVNIYQVLYYFPISSTQFLLNWLRDLLYSSYLWWWVILFLAGGSQKKENLSMCRCKITLTVDLGDSRSKNRSQYISICIYMSLYRYM